MSCVMPLHRPSYYILVGRTPIAVDSVTCAKSFENFNNRSIARDAVTDTCSVSTIFLGMDHNWDEDGDPILFETMIFGGPLDQEQWRYCTYAQAERGHAEALEKARRACAQVKAIASAAGIRQQ